MKILITGGAGFIGSHLSRYLLKLGHEIMVVDNFSTGKSIHDGVTTISTDISSRHGMDYLYCKRPKPDVIFHLAAAVGVKLVTQNPLRTYETNVKGTENILKFANEFDKKPFVVIASTSEVYGKSNKIPFCEEDDIVIGAPTKNRWGYACSKAMDEFMAMGYFRTYGLPIAIARLFNTVGLGQASRYGMVLPNFIERAKLGEPLEIYGTGEQTRCFAYVEDVVKALWSLVEHRLITQGQIFNIGSTEETSIVDLARYVISHFENKSTIKFIPYEVAYGHEFEDMMRRVPNTEKLYRYTGLQCRTTLTEIIEKFK